MIPNEAIAAAAKAFIEHGTLIPALEAAAPYLMEKAWDQGANSWRMPNPYRKESK